jgi:hypothetical protein
MEDLPNPPSADTRAAFAQVVASALKNQHPVAAFAGTLALHFAGFRGSRRQITRFGWQSSLAAGKSLTVGEVEWRDLAQSAPPVRTADWQVTVDRDGLARTDLEIELRRYLSVTPGTPAPDFRNRLTLVDPGARSVTVEPVNDEPVSLIDLLLALIKVFFHWMFRYTFIARGGRQIVGVNNVAILAFRWGAGEDKAVIQELHWWAKNFRTLYEAHDAADDAQYLTTTRCEVALAIREPPANEKIEF